MSKHWPLPEPFHIRLTMESDWHVGSGLGRPGIIDRLIARDADDLPFVPAKTLRGIWRDACERLCRGLDDGQLGDWSRRVDQLFGSQPALGVNDPTGRHGDPAEVPLSSAMQIRSVRIPPPLSDSLARADRRLRQALTFVKSGVQIDRRSGSAQTDFLRFEEVARKGIVLEAECRLAVGDPSTREMASALLIASAQMVERLGGKRRRGLGRCRLEILDADTNAAIGWLERTVTSPRWSPGRESNASPDTQHIANQNDPWICVPLVLQLQGPLAVSYRTTGNVGKSLNFVPGSYLLPHVTRTLSGLGLDVRSALQSGDVCVLPAYPEVDGERGQPVPLALFAPKGLAEPFQKENRKRVINRLLDTEPADGTQLKQMREGYVSTQPTKAYKTPITVRTHNTIEDQLQRPSGAVGGVYSYEAIMPSDRGTPVVLRCELRVRKSLADRLRANWWNRLNGEVSLGRSRKDDYGSVRLNAEPAVEWNPPTRNTGSDLFVWLVSDTLLRNRRLRPEPTAACLGEELSRRLGVRLKLRQSTNGRIDELVRIRRLDTWHVGWGLPRPSLVALQAGSCMVFQVEGTIDLAKLAQIEAGGIGERTAEGYGQVRFNHPLLSEPLTRQADVATPSGSTSVATGIITIDSNDPAFAFARRIERECWKQEIRRTCLAVAGDSSCRQRLLRWTPHGEQGQPPMSQLGGLRGQLSRLRGADDVTAILAWLAHLEANTRRRDRWPNGSIGLVRQFLTDTQSIWNELNPSLWPTLTTNAQAELRQDLWAVAVRTFFDACIRAHKRELESKQQRKEAARGA